MQITCKVLVSGGMGMGALLATLEAMGQCVPSSHQGALPRGLLHAPYTCAAIGHSSSKGALLDAYWWWTLAVTCQSSTIGCHQLVKYS